MVPQKVNIPGWPYYVTIDGEVFRFGSKKPLKPILRRDGYSVNLFDHGRSKYIRINNIMREAYFNGIKLPLKHLDGNKLNFSYWNLRPMTRSQMATFERPNGYHAIPVIETLPDGTENIYKSAAECARKIYVSKSTISKWCNGKHKNSVNENKYRWAD